MSCMRKKINEKIRKMTAIGLAFILSGTSGSVSVMADGGNVVGSLVQNSAAQVAEKLCTSHLEETAVPVVSGDCGAEGQEVKYTLYGNGSLYIYGTGKMASYSPNEGNYPPFFGQDITRLVVETGVTGIGAHAFYYQLGLEQVILPEGLLEISQMAFTACNALTTIEIPQTVTEIGEYALGYRMTNGAYGSFVKRNFTIIGKEDSVAKEYADSNNMTFVASSGNAFGIEQGQCGENASWSFDRGTGELKITGTGKMTDYEYYGDNKSPFYSDKAIKTVVIDQGITSIGENAFYLCSGIRTVRISDTVTEVATSAFGGCSGLKAFEAAEDNNVFVAPEGILYSKDRKQLVCYPGRASFKTLKLCEETQEFVSGWFVGYVDETDVETIIFGKNFKYIGAYALPKIKTLKSLVFEGDPPSPSSFTNYLNAGMKIYCHFSSDKWKNIMQSSQDKEFQWIDLDTLSDQPVITAEKKTLKRYEGMQLGVSVNPAAVNEFDWNSSNPAVLVVSDQGYVSAVGEGTAEISVTGKRSGIMAGGLADEQENRIHASITLSVTGGQMTLPEYSLVELKDDSFTYTGGKNIVQIPCETLGGFYCYQAGTLSFYSYLTGEITKVCSFLNVRDVYAANDHLYVLSGKRCIVYDLVSRRTENVFETGDDNAGAIGADDEGRIYVGVTAASSTDSYRILLFSKTGELLSKAYVGTKIIRFCGFDSTNGNFYMESDYDYYSWGYSHPGYGLTMGNVKGNVIKYVDTSSSFLEQSIISRSFSCIKYLGQVSYYARDSYARLLGGRYLAAVSVLTGDFTLYDSNAPVLTQVLSENRKIPEYSLASTYYDTTSIGVRAVYNDSHDTIIYYENGKVLSEIDPVTKEKIASVKTAHYVFNLLYDNDYVIAVEKEDDRYYLEIFRWNFEELSVSISPERESMKVGETQSVSVINSGGLLDYHAAFTSSDPQIATVTASGKIVAWKEGKVTITYRSLDGKLTAVCQVRVLPKDVPANYTHEVKGVMAGSDNRSRNDYNVWSKAVTSYLVENDDQTLTRIQYSSDKVIVEKYTKEDRLAESRSIEMELPLFGGFYSGKEYCYFVFGDQNPEQSDEKEVLRVVKYTKDFARVSDCRITGANTYIPFDAGSLRMTETNGQLYVYTCHEMYAGEGENVHHQANMTFVIDQTEMKVTDSYYDVMNLDYGYVSHSFNQFILTDGEYVYRIDHGDANPRAVSLTRCAVEGKVTEVAWRKIFPIHSAVSYNYNATGVSVGGAVLTGENCIVAGSSVDQSSEEYNVNGQKNIFLVVTDQKLEQSKTVWLTQYTDGKILPKTPQLISLEEEHFLVLWEEYDTTEGSTVVRSMTFDGDGNLAASKKYRGLRLSDCQPVYTSGEVVKWYVTDGSVAGNEYDGQPENTPDGQNNGRLTFYAISPYATDLRGDVNGDGEVDIADALMLSRYDAGLISLTEPELRLGDVNGDGVADIADALMISRYDAGLTSL